MKWIIGFGIFLLLTSVAMAVELGSDSVAGVVVQQLESETNYSIQNVNSSDYWDDLDTPLDFTDITASGTAEIQTQLKLTASSDQLYLGSSDEAHIEVAPTGFNFVSTGSPFNFNGQFYTFVGQSETDILLSFSGTSNTGQLRWMEDEDYFKFSDDVYIDSDLECTGVITGDGSGLTNLNTFNNSYVSRGELNDTYVNVDGDTMTGDLNTTRIRTPYYNSADGVFNHSSDTADKDIMLNFLGTSNQGAITYLEDESVFRLSYMGATTYPMYFGRVIGADYYTGFSFSPVFDTEHYAFLSEGTETLFNSYNNLDLRWRNNKRLQSNQTDVIINPQNQDVDFSVQGDNDVNLIVADASTDKVGIGVHTPTHKLDVDGDVNITGSIAVGGGGINPNIAEGFNAYGNYAGFYYKSAGTGADVSGWDMFVNDQGGYGVFNLRAVSDNLGSASNLITIFRWGTAPHLFAINWLGDDMDFNIRGDTDNNLFYTDAGNDRIGIGKNNPAEKLDIAGTLIATNYKSSDGSLGITNTTGYWLCADSDCNTTCQVSIKNGLITGCV